MAREIKLGDKVTVRESRRGSAYLPMEEFSVGTPYYSFDHNSMRGDQVGVVIRITRHSGVAVRYPEVYYDIELLNGEVVTFVPHHYAELLENL